MKAIYRDDVFTRDVGVAQLLKKKEQIKKTPESFFSCDVCFVVQPVSHLHIPKCEIEDDK